MTFNTLSKHSYLILLAVVSGLLFSSCKKHLEVQNTVAQPETKMWKNYDDARAGLAGMYGLSRAALARNNAHWMYGELRAGDFQAVTKGGYIDAVINNELNRSFTQIKELTNWTPFYAAIDACNTFIERSGECKQDFRYSELNNKVDVAQARVLRSFLYFYMVRIWGDVPLITKSAAGSFDEQVARTPQREVMQFCISELMKYKDSLPTSYGGDDTSPLAYRDRYYGGTWNTWGNAFWGQYQAWALLAQMYAWIGDYDNVIVAGGRVWSTPTGANASGVSRDPHSSYVTFDQMKSGYLTDGPSSIFYGKGIKGSRSYQLVAFPYDMDNSESGPSGVGHIESLTLASPFVPRALPDIYVPRDTIDMLFYASGDLRNPYQPSKGNYDEVYFTNYFGNNPIFIKFRNIAPGSTSFPLFGSCIPIMRMEDIALLIAEAYYMRGGAVNIRNAYRAVNGIRKQRNTPGFYDGLTDPNGTLIPFTQASLENGILWNIFRERRIELMGEGVAWYDKIRYNRLVPTENPEFTRLINEGGIYWPIDEEIIRKNPLIEQNSYWKK